MPTNILINPARFGGAVPSFVALGADFNGTTQYGSRATMTGQADGRFGILSVWAWFDALASNRVLFQSTAAHQQLSYVNTTTEVTFLLEAPGGALIANLEYSLAPSTGAWHHLLLSWNLNTAGSARYYFDDTNVLTENLFTTGVDTDYTNSLWTIGGDNAGALKLDGRLGEFYFNIAEYMDFSVTNNRRKFISSTGTPVDLGSNGSAPTGTAPIIYCSRRPGDAADVFFTNRGTGGNFTVNGSPLGDGGTIAL